MKNVSEKLGKIASYAWGGLIVSTLLVMCTPLGKVVFPPPDYSAPHEYFDTVAYGINGESHEGNDHRFHLSFSSGDYFPIGEGKCSKYLAELDPKLVDLEMKGFNSYLDSEKDFNDVRAERIIIQCVAVGRVDQECVETAIEKKMELLREGQFHMPAGVELESLGSGKCREEVPIGQPRVFQLR
jgi:hypothetical protein